MTPLQITAHLSEGIVLRDPIALDALLGAVIAQRRRLLPPTCAAEVEPLELPLQRSECGRVWLASFSLHEVERSAVRHKNRRAPAYEMARLGTSKIRRVDIAAGANKSYRVPYVWNLLRGDRLDWFALGDPDGIRDLLRDVHYLGKHRGSGKGKLRGEWAIQEVEPWDGFPVVLHGKPLRNLPLDWPGLESPRSAMRCIDPPYWLRETEELCAIPS